MCSTLPLFRLVPFQKCPSAPFPSSQRGLTVFGTILGQVCPYLHVGPSEQLSLSVFFFLPTLRTECGRGGRTGDLAGDFFFLPTLRKMASLSSTAQCSVTSAADDEVSKVCIFGDLRSRVCGDLRFEINVHPILFVGGWFWHCAV